jgi:hypothetical protein
MSDNTCGLCHHVETQPTGECQCVIDLNDIIKVGYYEVREDCFESRSGMFDKESFADD